MILSPTFNDLISGANNTHIATLVERHTRFAIKHGHNLLIGTPALAIYRTAMENFTRATVSGPNVPLPLASQLRAGGSANYRYCSIGSSPTVT
jgi:hypothetical protein